MSAQQLQASLVAYAFQRLTQDDDSPYAHQWLYDSDVVDLLKLEFGRQLQVDKRILNRSLSSQYPSLDSPHGSKGVYRKGRAIMRGYYVGDSQSSGGIIVVDQSTGS